MKKRIVIIPARGGSKGVPKKNIVDINGKPLISYTIEPALKLKEKGIVDEVIVSTDSEEIADISISSGATVPFMRPEYLASDTSKSVDVLIHALKFYANKGIHYNAVILLQPTTPLRTVADIENAIEMFDSYEEESLISCYQDEYICDLVSYYKAGDHAVALNENHNKGYRRQDIKDLYIRNGAIYITDSKYLLEEKKVISDKPLMYVMPVGRSVNIDTAEDLELVRWKLSK